MMWLKKIKHRKIQCSVIAIILMISTAILLACTSMTLETHRFTDEYFNYKDTAITYDIVNHKETADNLKNNKKLMSYVKRIETTDVKCLDRGIYINDKYILSKDLKLYEMDGTTKLDITTLPEFNGIKKSTPDDNELWVDRVFAKTNKLKVGDILRDKSKNSKDYKIAAIVDSKKCCSGFLEHSAFYCNSKTFESFNDTQCYAVNIYAKNNSVTSKTITDALSDDYADDINISLALPNLKMCISILTIIFGAVGVIAAIIILTVSIIVIRYIVRSSINKEYKMIGIYKSIGKHEKEIRNIYLFTYMFSSLIGIIPGVLLARPIAKYLGEIVIGHIKGYELTSSTDLLSIAVVLFMTLVVFINILVELKKLKNITPVNAINSGVKSSRKKIVKSVIPNAHSSFTMAINSIFKKRGMSILVIIVLTVSFYTCLLSSSIGLSLSHYADDKNIWENLPDYDGYIEIHNNEDVDNYLKNCPYIDDYTHMNIYAGKINMSFENSNMTAHEAHPMIYSDFKKDRYKNVPLTKGRYCTNPHEITVSKSFLKEVHKQVGDYINITIENKKQKFLIVGSYSAMMMGGTSFYIQKQDLKNLVTDKDISTVIFFLKKGVSYNQFNNDFKSHFSNSIVDKEFPFLIHEQNTVTDIAYPICIILFLSFLAFSILNIINVIYTTNKENRKKYGTLKAMGFSTGYIIRQSFFELSLECVIAIVITLILQQFLSPVLFSLASGVNYIYKPIWLSAIVCTGIYLLIIMLAMIMLLTIKKISPVELMEE